MAFGPAGLFAVRENWLFEPQNLGIHRRPQPPLRAAATAAADRLSNFFVPEASPTGLFAVRENGLFETQNLSIHRAESGELQRHNRRNQQQ
ncbi:hypothetical protein JCGZ_25321 [Jatropha curcas]|uniref:Uncharacterized protein n=1 Tax=Jatropha curcas TaxID=180498 RepID=A0A067LGK6_JATCU|nr:hypothetical protein JCGZ_25321 [Jatropha curcas]